MFMQRVLHSFLSQTVLHSEAWKLPCGFGFLAHAVKLEATASANIAQDKSLIVFFMVAP